MPLKPPDWAWGASPHPVAPASKIASERILGLKRALADPDKVWGIGSKVFAVGERGLIIQYDGRAWAQVPAGAAARIRFLVRLRDL